MRGAEVNKGVKATFSVLTGLYDIVKNSSPERKQNMKKKQAQPESQVICVQDLLVCTLHQTSNRKLRNSKSFCNQPVIYRFGSSSFNLFLSTTDLTKLWIWTINWMTIPSCMQVEVCWTWALNSSLTEWNILKLGDIPRLLVKVPSTSCNLCVPFNQNSSLLIEKSLQHTCSQVPLLLLSK